MAEDGGGPTARRFEKSVAFPMTASAPSPRHSLPRSPQLPARPLRRQTPAHSERQNRCWLEAYATSPDPLTRLHWRNRLVEANLGLVHSVAARFAGNTQLPYADLVQVGCQGLIRAVEAFDGRRARCLSTFAIPYVRGAIRHELRDRESSIRLPRSLWELRHRLRRLQEERRAQGLAPLAREELASTLGCTPQALGEAEGLREVAQPLSLDALQGGHGDAEGVTTWLDQLADPRSLSCEPLSPGASANDGLQRAQVNWLRHQLNQLDPLQRDLVLARVLVGCSWVELGRQHGLHPRMAERRCNGALRHLKALAEGWRDGLKPGG
ncbi:MAG: sigma-70 family RNA polymerase sigma factor [Cyanobium sp.]